MDVQKAILFFDGFLIRNSFGQKKVSYPKEVASLQKKVHPLN
jgi:hypothetical protein